SAKGAPAKGALAKGAPAKGGPGVGTLVYVGPTLPADEVRALLPGATVMPPAAVGDILRAAHQRGVRRIAIIDGYFERMAAVWHKEILVALERGIEVWGAASMGALRAAELDVFGMRGVGVIYDRYRRGALVADDEVAVAHLPAEVGYRAVSDALVNIRYALEVAIAKRLVSQRTATELLARAKATFYRERSWATLVAGIPRLEGWQRPDRKADDARLLLRKLLRTPHKPSRRKLRVPRTWALRQLESLML
ncbi:MAG TPA: TfuA-like protein, partial [Kofleriaceae bacterium]|nr:TfuA-like protein [Kofleriaceae bacterium]